MKVLILHQHFKIPQTGGAIRSYYLARALVEKGIDVVVITAHNEAAYKKAVINGIEVHYLPVPYDNRFGFRKRVLAFYKFMIGAVKYAAQHRDANCCYAISTPLTTGVAAMRISRRYGIPYLFEVGDLWPDAPIEMGFVKNRFLQQFLFRMERKIYHHAESVIALSVPIRDAVNRKVSGKQVHVLPNMADTDFYKPEEKQLALKDKFKVSNKFVVSYIGALGVANGLDYLLACAGASAREGLPVHFLICGDGAMLPLLKRSAEQSALTNVTFLPFRNRERVAEIMNVTDAAFICYQPFMILETGSPNKYFDGLAAGKLIIVNFGGWIREEIEKEGCGIYVNSRQPDDFVQALKPFLDDPLRLKHHGRRARELAERKYSRKMLAQQFLDIVRPSLS